MLESCSDLSQDTMYAVIHLSKLNSVFLAICLFVIFLALLPLAY